MGDNIKERLDKLLKKYHDKFDYGNVNRVMAMIDQDEPDFDQLKYQEDWALYYNLKPGLKGKSFQDLKKANDPFYLALKNIAYNEDGTDITDLDLQAFFDSNCILELRDDRGRTIRPITLSTTYKKANLDNIIKKNKL